MAVSNVKAVFGHNVQRVWDVVTSLEKLVDSGEIIFIRWVVADYCIIFGIKESYRILKKLGLRNKWLCGIMRLVERKGFRMEDTNGSIENYTYRDLYYHMCGVGYFGTDAGGKVSRSRRDQRRGGKLLGQKQRPFHGREARQDYDRACGWIHGVGDCFKSDFILR